MIPQFRMTTTESKPTSESADDDVDRWRKRHGGKGMPLCECCHDPPCPACAASIAATIAKYGRGCSCSQQAVA